MPIPKKYIQERQELTFGRKIEIEMDEQTNTLYRLSIETETTFFILISILHNKKDPLIKTLQRDKGSDKIHKIGGRFILNEDPSQLCNRPEYFQKITQIIICEICEFSQHPSFDVLLPDYDKCITLQNQIEKEIEMENSNALIRDL